MRENQQLQDYGGAALESLLGGTAFLDENDLAQLQALGPEMEDVFRHAQMWRTRTEMECSILNDHAFPTPDSKYWQAAREQNTFFGALVDLSYDYRLAQVGLKRLNLKHSDLQKQLKDARNKRTDEDPAMLELDLETNAIEIERQQWSILQMEHAAKDRIRELREWSEIKTELLPSLEHSLTDVNEHQLISYAKQYTHKALALDGSNVSPSERFNILGQLDKLLKVAKERGVIEKVLPLDSPERQALIGRGLVVEEHRALVGANAD